MKKYIFIIGLFLFSIELSAQCNDDYLVLYNELIEIFRNEFVLPIESDEIRFKNDIHFGFGYKIHIFSMNLMFVEYSYLYCEMETEVFSMSQGIVKEVSYGGYYGDIIVIKYGEIEIEYRNIALDGFNLNDQINAGQILGKVKYINHNGFNDGFVLKIKYYDYYFDAEILLNNIEYFVRRREQIME